MRSVLASLFKQANGTWDLSRVLMACMALAFIGQSAYALWRGQAFDWQSFGIGAGAITGGGAAGVWMHGKSPQ